MNSQVLKTEFWNFVEKELRSYPISLHIKNIFAIQDLDNHLTLKNFNIKQLPDLEYFVWSEHYKVSIPANANISEYYGKYDRFPNFFKFSFGEQILIQQIIDLVRMKYDEFLTIAEIYTKNTRKSGLNRAFDEIDKCHETFIYPNESKRSGAVDIMSAQPKVHVKCFKQKCISKNQ